MTKKELVEELEKYPDDLLIYFGDDNVNSIKNINKVHFSSIFDCIILSYEEKL